MTMINFSIFFDMSHLFVSNLVSTVLDFFR